MIRKTTIAGKDKNKYWQDLRIKSLKNKPLKKTAVKNKRKYKIKSNSTKGGRALRIYSVLRKNFLLDHPVCECGRKDTEWNICERPSEEVHHKKGRGKWLNVVEFFLPVAADCHKWIEAHPKEAKELGLSLPRID